MLLGTQGCRSSFERSCVGQRVAGVHLLPDAGVGDAGERLEVLGHQVSEHHDEAQLSLVDIGQHPARAQVTVLKRTLCAFRSLEPRAPFLRDRGSALVATGHVIAATCLRRVEESWTRETQSVE